MNQCTLSQQKEIIDIIQYKFILNGETTIKDLESEISENVIKDFKFTEFKDNSEITNELIKNGINIEELFDTDSSSTIYKSNVVKNISTYSIDDLFKGIPVAKKYFDSYLGEIIVREAIIGRGDSDHYVDNDHELSENFNNLKNKLFIEIQEFLQSEGLLSTDVVELFENERIIDYAYYNHIMGLVSDYFFSGENVGLLTFEGKLVPNLNIDLDGKEHLFKAYNNVILLTNFDSIINTELKGMIEINYNYFNHLNNSIGRNPKYRLKVAANSLLYWNRDNHDSKSSENKEDQITKMVVNSIPAYNKNNQKLPESMEMKDLYLLGSMIHSFELKYGNKFKNNDVEFEYFNKNPGQSLVWYLQKIIQAFNKEGDYISEFNDSLKIGERGGFNFRDVINLTYSLNNYINDPELNILAKEKTSTNSLLSIIGQVINNNFGVIYSVFNTDSGLEVQNMHQQDFNSTYINNTVLSYMVTNALNKDMYDLKNKEELDKFNGIFDTAFEENRNQDIYIYSLNNPSIVEEFSEYISEKTGIPFSNFSFVDLINEMKIQHNKTRIEVSFFKNKVSEFINSINKDFKNKTFNRYLTKATSLTSGKVLNNTVSNAFYKSLSKTYLTNFITKPAMNLTTELGSKVPSFRTSTLTFKDTEIFDLQRTYEKTEGTSYRSLLLKDSSAILGTSTKLEVTNPLTEDEYNSVKDAAKLTPQESFIADFRYEFWDSLMKQDTFQIILGNYSDKNTVFTKIINGRFQLEGSNKIIIQEDMDVLLETVRTQAFKYYSDTFKKVFEDYKELFSKTGFENEANQITDDFENNVKVINNILLRNNIIDLLSIYAELPFSLKNPNLTITEELHYSNYSGGTSINQLLADNYRIFGNINLFNEFVSVQEQSFMDKTVSNQNNTLNHMNSAKGDFNQIASKLGLNFDEFSDEFDKIQLKSGKLNPIVRKWMWLNSLFRNEYTFMTSKGEYMHPHKNNSTFRSGEFNGDYWAKYSLEMSGRLDSMAKRNVIFTASIESPVRNSKYGTTEKVNIAAIQDSKAQVYTSSGHKKYNQDAYDGSSYIEDLHSRMLTASFPGKGYGGTMKQFGTMITPYSVTLKKDAETVLTNDRIRTSHSSTNSLLNKKKQMLSIPLNDIIFNDDVLRFEDLYINHLGKQYQIYRVELTNESGQNKLKLFNSLVEDNDKLDQPILEVNVNTLYDIWDAFGGIYSIDEKGNFNEKSNEALYNVVTETNDGKLKNKLIHILSNVSSLKAGATNINSSARWQDSKPLLYSSYDNRFMGPQLDASHGIDNSEIKEVTQLVSALAQGGFTSEVAQEAYEDIANVIKTSAQPYLNSMKADDKKLYYYLTDKFIETINNAKGESIAKTLIHSIKEDGINIPFSNNNFFGLFVRDVVTRLNNEFISRHYSGIGSVLIPSHGIFQVYDRVLPDGRTIVMTQADLIKEALQEYDSIEFERIYGRQPVNNEEIIEFYKSTILVDLPVNIGEIEVGDTVLINGQNLSLSTPEEYYRFKRSYQQDTVIKVYSKPRDLKPTSHTFKVNGQQRNIFDFKSLELLYKNKEIIDSLNKGEQIVIDSSVILLNDFSNYISHKNNKSFDLLNNLNKNSIEVLKLLEKYLRQWVQRDFELLHEGLAMTNHISNFSEYFGNDNFTDVLSDVIENYRLYAQPVTDVVFKSAEKVVGDIYQTNFGRDLNDSMYEINKKGALFFKEKLLKYYGKDNVEADLKIISDKSDKPIYIKYVDELGLLDRTINIKSSIKSEDDLKRTYIRYNELGEEIYSFTDSDNVRVSTDEDGNEIIYVRFGKKYNDDRKRIYGHHKTKSFEKNVKGIIKSFKGSIKAVVPLMNRDARTTSFFSYDENGIIPKGNYNFNFGEFTIEVFKNFTGIEVLEDHIYSSNWFERNKDNILDRMSNSMYISWQKSHELIDARIPGQSMQSFMPMKNIAYMNTTTNDSYISITQVFLQGSDFDIDKAYTLGSGFTSNGKLDLWTNLSEYSSIEQLNELEKLPLPTNRKINLANPDITEELNLEEVENINATEDYNDIVESIAIYGETMNTNYQFPVETIKLFNKFLRKYSHLDNIVITSVSNRLSREKFINLINAHNLDSSFRNKEGVVKNSVISRIKQIISDPRNQILANTPVTVQDWHDAIKIVEDRKSQTLINSSHSGNVKVAGKEGIPKFMDSKRNRNYKAMKEYAIKNGYIYTLREQGDEHFGNPYSNMNVKGTIPTKSTKESVEKFINWILYNPDEIQEDRRQWILTQLRNGSLKNKPLLYDNDLREPSHANALDYLINQFDWSNKTNIESLQNRGAINNASKNNIKPGVSELFDSNPESANQVYESLGFNQESNNIEILTSNYTRQSVQNDVDSLYLFTDNAQRTSRPSANEENVDKNSWYYKKYKSQTNKPIHFGSTSNPTSAVIRGLNNAYPISTMSAYGTNWTDSNFELFKQTIDDEIAQIKKDLSKFSKVKIGDFRIGQGGRFAKLPQQHQQYLDNKLLEIGIDNTGNKPKIINSPITPEQIPEEIDEKSNVINSLYTNHSGGADGSDSYWDYIGRIHGLKNHRHYFIQGFNTPKGNVGLSSDFIEEATEHVLNANKTLRRRYPTKDAYIDSLLLRNWAQVKNADTVFAIGKLKGNEVEGGTGWAVQMAIDNLKPVFVFDQFKNNWYEYNYELGLFKKSDIPVLTKNFAGIGTREINSLGIQAIKDVYNKTLGTIDYDSTEIYREITKNTEVKNLKGEERPLITESFLETNKKFRGIPVIISDDFKGAASFNIKTKTIQINIPLMKQKFEEKAWSKPNTLQDNTKVDPFPEEQFSNFEEWLTFVVLHEYYRSKLERKRFDNGNLEPLNVYENRINEHAFKTLRDTYNTDIANVDESKIEMVTEEKSTKLNNKKLLSSYDMMSYYIQQYNASVGKDDVGIAANGVKTLYALSSYYNTYYKNNNFEPDLVNSFKSFNKNFTFLKNGELMSLGGNFTTIADVQMNNVQRKMFEEFDSSFNIKFVNAANNLSGFLSAATDNAKELIMAKVNASTDLASMHIYLMILGLDIDQVVEIMTSDIMEDIINKMDHNVFSMKRKLSFNTVIDELSKTYKNRGDNDSIYNLNTYLNIYKAASELTSLSTLLGINQKRKATTWEIYNYLNTFSKTLVNLERNKIPINILETYKLRKNPEEIIKYIHTISRQTNIEEIVNSAHALGIIGGSFDFERYFAEPSYKQATKEYYNLIKETFNVFDILDEVPHFREMVNSLVLFHNILKKYSTKYNYIFDLFRDSIGDTNPTEDIIKRGILYNDSRAREEWFKTDKMLNFSFDLKNLMKMAKKDNFTLYTSSSAQKNSEKEKHSVVVDINDDSNPLISLENNEGIANFKNAFEQLLLPILQSNLKNNNFLKLENTINPFGIQTSHVAPTVATSNINVPALVKQFQKALKTFDELDTSFDINYQIKNNLSEFVKWKDIIFVYNLIVNNERYGDKRITPLLQNYMHDKNSLGYDYIKFWSRIDNGLELMNESSETDIKFYVNNKQGIDLTKSLYGDNPDFPIITNVQETEQIKIHNKNINDIIRLIKEGGYIITLKC